MVTGFQSHTMATEGTPGAVPVGADRRLGCDDGHRNERTLMVLQPVNAQP